MTKEINNLRASPAPAAGGMTAPDGWQKEAAAAQASAKRGQELIEQARAVLRRYEAGHQTDISGVDKTLSCAAAVLTLTTTTALDNMLAAAPSAGNAPPADEWAQLASVFMEKSEAGYSFSKTFATALIHNHAAQPADSAASVPTFQQISDSIRLNMAGLPKAAMAALGDSVAVRKESLPTEADHSVDATEMMACPECDLIGKAACPEHGGDSAAAPAAIDKLRQEQAEAVMPLIGPLLDAWEGMPNDARSGVEQDSPSITTSLRKISAAMSAHPPAQPADACAHCGRLPGDPDSCDWVQCAALSPEKPAKPAAIEQRQAFEAWCVNQRRSQRLVTDRDESGEYEFTATRLAWKAWQAAVAAQADHSAQAQADTLKPQICPHCHYDHATGPLCKHMAAQAQACPNCGRKEGVNGAHLCTSEFAQAQAQAGEVALPEPVLGTRSDWLGGNAPAYKPLVAADLFNERVVMLFTEPQLRAYGNARALAAIAGKPTEQDDKAGQDERLALEPLIADLNEAADYLSSRRKTATGVALGHTVSRIRRVAKLLPFAAIATKEKAL